MSLPNKYFTIMKVAVQISGQPRFTKDLTDFINNLQGSYQADWFVLLWENNPLPDKVGYPDLKFMHDSWRRPVYDKAVKCIEKNLPSNHRLINLLCEDCKNSSAPNFKNVKEVPSVQQVWNMWYGWKKVNEMRIEHERIHGHYDIVVKMRGDCGLAEPLDLSQIQLPGITVSKDHWFGFDRKINDLFAIGDPRSITEYCTIMNYAEQYSQEIPFHSETMLAYHLEKRNVRVHKGNWGFKFRSQIQKGQFDWGNWTCED